MEVFSLDFAFSLKLSCKASPVTTPAAPAKEAKVESNLLYSWRHCFGEVVSRPPVASRPKAAAKAESFVLKMCARSKQSDRSDKFDRHDRFDRCQDEQAS